MINRLAWAAAGLFYSVAAFAFPEGAEPGYTGGWGEPDCSACHFAGPAASKRSGIQLVGLAQQLVAGETYRIEIRLTDTEQRVAGFQLAIRDAENGQSSGQLKPGEGQQLQRAEHIEYLNHSEPAAAISDGAEHLARWFFHWTPEGQQPVEISIAAVAADNDDSPLGDMVYLFNRKIMAD